MGTERLRAPLVRFNEIEQLGPCVSARKRRGSLDRGNAAKSNELSLETVAAKSRREKNDATMNDS